MGSKIVEKTLLFFQNFKKKDDILSANHEFFNLDTFDTKYVCFLSNHGPVYKILLFWVLVWISSWRSGKILEILGKTILMAVEF